MHRLTNMVIRTLLVTVMTFSISAAQAVAEKNVLRWAGCGITKKAFMAELARGYEKKTGIKINLEGGGATRGIRDTATLKIDIGGSCRMSLPEYDRAELYASLHPVAWDALAIIVHKSNPVKNLTTAQIKNIYSGKITNWRQLGGKNIPLKLYVRMGTISGVGYAIRQYIFKDGGVQFKTRYQVRSSGPLEKAVEKDPAAMGITGISSARKRKVKIISFDGKQPSYANVKNGQYQLYRPLYLVTSPKPSSAVKKFISYAMSEEGRKIIRANKTVPYRDAPSLMSKMLIYGFDVR